MVKPTVADDVPQTADGTGLLIECAEDDPGNAGLHRGSGTHRAWLKRDNKGAVVEAPGVECHGGLAHGNYLGVGSRVGINLSSVGTPTDDGATRIEEKRADGDVVRFQS